MKDKEKNIMAKKKEQKHSVPKITAPASNNGLL